MNFKPLFIASTILSVLIVSPQLMASGGESDDNDSSDGPFGGSSDFDRIERVVDPTYESGKAIYTGRKRTVAKLSYCILSEQETVKVKRKTIKQFKQSSYSELAKSLYQCDVPGSTIKSQLESKDFLHVLYYLNKRYKLNLQRS